MAAIAPMDLVMSSDTTSIPLRCTICPKKPNFSDLSHLLTHISSKSHLAHRFKAELRARDDRTALEEVRQYDTWCERYGINALLAERMAAKEQKKTGRRGRPSGTSSNSKPQIVVSHQDFVKPDPDEYDESMQATVHWSAVPSHFQHAHHDPFDDSNYLIPNLKRSRSDRSVPSTPDNGRYYRRWPSETETTDSVPVSEIPSETTEFDEDNDLSKLKGVRYPGMGLFDSADELQKRMRNQRKDDSVLRHMEQTSSGIEPNEFVWAEDGEFQRIRDIYASPSIDGSPDRKLEDRNGQKAKRGRRPAAAAMSGPSRTRASTRLTRQTASRNKRSQQDDSDVFRDPPKPSSVRTGSPQREHGYELRRRPALQSVNRNVSLASTTQKPPKPASYIAARETTVAGFTSQPPVSSSHYFQPHTLGAGTFNPLCVQPRGVYYNPYTYSNFGNETKPSPTNFQAISAMNMASMPFNAYGGPFASESTQERADQDFDL